MSKQIFRLKVPASPVSEFVSHGNHDFTLVPNETIEVTDPRVARWLEAEHGLGLIETVEEETTPSSEADATPPQTGGEPELVDPETYPADFPGRDALIKANVPFDTVKTLTEEQLDEYPGIGPKTAAEIVEYFPNGGTE